MGAPIIYLDNYNLWVSNGVKDYFCDVIFEGAKMRKIDISKIHEEDSTIGFYGVSGLGIAVEDFFPHFSGKKGFLQHLEYCKKNIEQICDNETASKSMFNILCWVEYMINGGEFEDNINFCELLPPEN